MFWRRVECGGMPLVALTFPCSIVVVPPDASAMGFIMDPPPPLSPMDIFSMLRLISPIRPPATPLEMV